MKVLIFAGAGVSAELSVPAMRVMALELHEHLTRTGAATRLLSQLGSLLEDEENDVESLIDDLDKVCTADRALAALGEAPIASDVVAAALEARSETEWFVQAACERLRPEDAELMWTPLLQQGHNTDLTIATTNYDRAIEIAAARLRIEYDDGFESFSTNEWARWCGFAPSGHVRLLKIHGSTDWYRVSESDDIVKLRHPMPLFGGVSLRLPGESPGSLGSALVLPSREKLKNLPPFPDLSHELYGAARIADAVVFVGSSLRDPDLRHLCRMTADDDIPTLVVSRSARSEPEGTVPAKAYALRQSASTFLISTLPRMLQSNELTHACLQLAVAQGQDRKHSMMAPLRTLTGSQASIDERSGAIESLWRLRADLGFEWIKDLLGDGNGAIAVDALGLIPMSRDHEVLRLYAIELASTSGSGPFQSEVELLQQVLKGLEEGRDE